MYLIIEHSGTLEHNKLAEYISGFAEDEFGMTCQPVVGSEDGPIVLYSEDLTKVAEFDHAPDTTELYFYLSEMEDEK